MKKITPNLHKPKPLYKEVKAYPNKYIHVRPKKIDMQHFHVPKSSIDYAPIFQTYMLPGFIGFFDSLISAYNYCFKRLFVMTVYNVCPYHLLVKRKKRQKKPKNYIQ